MKRALSKEELKRKRWIAALEKSKGFLTRKIDNSLGLKLPVNEEEFVAVLRSCYARGFYDGKYT